MRLNVFLRTCGSVTLPAVLAGLTLGASAQNASTSADGATKSATAQGSSTKAAKPAASKQISASKMIGMSVRGPKGESLGEIYDLAVDMKSGQVRFALLEFDPSILADERIVAVPIKELRPGPYRNVILQNAQKQKLQQLSMPKDDWNFSFLKDQDRVAKIEQAWGLPRDGGKGTLVRASDLMDKDVKNRSGEYIGEIEDLVIDMDQQKVHHALMELDRGWLSLGRTIAVPLSSFSNAAGGDDEVVMDLTKDKAKGMEGLNRDQMRRPEDPRVVAIVQRHLLFLDPKSASTNMGAGPAQSSASKPASQAK